MMPAPETLERTPVVALICAPVILASLVLAWAEPRDQAADLFGEVSLASAPGGAADSGNVSKAGPLREGTEVADLSGTFRLVDQRAVFMGEKRRFMVLENLGLERVVRTMTDTPGELEWLVAGTVTEYRGTNYLLLKRAVLRGRTADALSAGRPADSQRR